MNDYKRGDRVRFAGQIVKVATTYDRANGDRSYLVEFSDGTFSRAREDALMPVGAELEFPSKGKLPSVTASMGSYFRQPAKVKRVLK